MNFLKFLLLLTIFLTPLLGAVGGLGYEQVKVLFFILNISLIGFLWMFKKPKVKWTNIKIASSFFILILFLTSILGIQPTYSFLGIPPYFQGWILYAYLVLFSLMVSSFDIKLKHYALVLTSSALIVSGLAIEDWILKNLGYLVPNYAGRVVSTFGQPNFFAGFLLLTLPFSYFLFKEGNKKLSYLGMVSGLTSIIGIFVSYSRAAIILSLILVALGLINQLKIKISLVIFILVIILTGGLWKSEFSKPLSSNNPDLTRESVEKRVYIWPQFIKIASEKPITGYGLENIGKSFSNYFIENKHSIFEENLNIQPILISLKELYIDRTHNYLLDLMLFSGILGVGVWLLLVVLLFKKCRNKYLLTGLFTYLIWIQFQNQSIVHLIYFWFLVGAIDKSN